jgi:predicted nucleic acid-binding protein
MLTRGAARSLVGRLDELLRQEPYELIRPPAEVVDVAEAQIRTLPLGAYCPTLDRLHLSVMKSLGLDRLLTNDDPQARAARALGCTVIMPRSAKETRRLPKRRVRRSR